MPGMYPPGEFDLAGFCVGAVERENILPRDAAPGDVMIGLASSGAHSNGYSLIRKIAADSGARFDAPAPFDSTKPLGAALLAPTRIYVKSVLPLLANPQVKSFAHITGGGLTDNVPRILSEHLAPSFDEKALTLPPLFQWLRDAGDLGGADMRRTFNCGIGGVLVCAPDTVDACIAALTEAGETAGVIWRDCGARRMTRAKLAVLISGRGTNLQSLIDASADSAFPAEVSLVISNRPKAEGLERATKAGIHQLVIDHKDFQTREDFDDALHDALRTTKIDYVCLAGFYAHAHAKVRRRLAREIDQYPSITIACVQRSSRP